MICLVNIEQNFCQEEISQLKFMSNAMPYIDKSFAVKNSGPSCLAFDIQLEQSEDDNPARKKSVQGCEIRRVIYRFLIGRYESKA